MSVITAITREEYKLQKENIEVLDQEWLSLMHEAQKLGLSIEEIIQFLKNPILPSKN